MKQAAILERLMWWGPKGGLWPSASKMWGPQANNMQETEFCQWLWEFGSRSPVEPSDETSAMSNTFNAAYERLWSRGLG